MDKEIFCVSILFIPDSFVGCMGQILFLVILVGFLLIVVASKKYRFMIDWFEKKFGDWY